MALPDIVTGQKCWLRLNEGTGTACANSAAPGGLTAVLNSAGWAAGQIGPYSANLNGARYIDVTDPTNILNITGTQLTLSAWIFPTVVTGAYFRIFERGGNFPLTQYALILDRDDGTLGFQINLNGTLKAIVHSGDAVVPNVWSHVSATVSNGVVSIYINGISQNVIDWGASSITSFPGAICRIGGYTGDGSLQFPGRIDDPRIYARALSVTDLKGLICPNARSRVVFKSRVKGIDLGIMPLSYDYGTAAAPASTEFQLYNPGTVEVAQAWQGLVDPTIAGGTVTGKALAPCGLYEMKMRTKDIGGTVLETSPQSQISWAIGICPGSAGQSNEAGMFAEGEAHPEAAAETMQRTAAGWIPMDGSGAIHRSNAMVALFGVPIGFYNASLGGTTIEQWRDEDGPLFSALRDQLIEDGNELEGVCWQQGEQDAVNHTPKATYKTEFAAIYDQFLTLAAPGSGPADFFFCATPIGTIDHISVDDDSAQAIREATNEVIAENAGFIHGGSAMDLVIHDGFHYTGPYYAHKGLRHAQAIAQWYGAATFGAIGPAPPASVTLTDRTLILDLTPDGGTGLTQLDATNSGSGLTGFIVSNDNRATNLLPSSTRYVESKILLHYATAPPLDCLVDYQYGEKPDISNPVFDNTFPQGDTVGLPLRPFISLPIVVVAPSLTNQIRYVEVFDLSGNAATGLIFSDFDASYNAMGGAQVALTTENITQLGIYQAPTSEGHIRIKEWSIPGVYEVQFHDSQLVAGDRLWLWLESTGNKTAKLEIDLDAARQSSLEDLGEAVGDIDVSGSAAAQVDNSEVVEARVYKLGRRSDGVMGCNRVCYMKASDKYPVWIDTSAIASRWLDDALPATVEDDAVATPAQTGINRQMIVLWIEALTVGQTSIRVEAKPRGADSLICELIVNVKA